jgi:23S rRNA G2069 N7-methylase RlmK/C1962 C5-methylase RlmI
VVGRQAATPAIDEDAIIAKAEARIEAKRQEAENADAWREFVESNPAFADETSKQRQYGDYLFNTVYGPKLEAGELSYREALRAAAQDVATVFHGEPEAPARNVREERKQRIDNLPTAGARAVRQAPKSESVEDVLEDMRRMRGQPV